MTFVSRMTAETGAPMPRWLNSQNGYVTVGLPDGSQVYEHRYVVERAIGRELRGREEVHHVDTDRANNANGNLVACQNTAYHRLLDRRGRAYDACGHPDWLKCVYCRRYDHPDALSPKAKSAQRNAYHKPCAAAYMRVREAGNVRVGNRNTAKTRCPQGHPYDAENTYMAIRRSTGRVNRQCKRCKKAKKFGNYDTRRSA